MNINDYVPLIFRRLRPQSRPNEATSLITQLAQKYGLENIGEIDEQFLNGFTCASEIVIAQLEKEFESDDKGLKKVGDLTLREIKQMCNEKCDKELIYSCMPCSESEFCPCDYILKAPFLWDSADLEKELPRGDKAE